VAARGQGVDAGGGGGQVGQGVGRGEIQGQGVNSQIEEIFPTGVDGIRFDVFAYLSNPLCYLMRYLV